MNNNKRDAIRKANAIPNKLEKAGVLYSLGERPSGIPFLNICLQKGFTVDHCEDEKLTFREELNIHISDETKVVLKKNGVTCSPRFDDFFDLEVYCWQNLDHYDQLSGVVVAA